jgi:predicted ATPase
MIKQIKIQHFFSFGESAEINLNTETNVLVGINGSGKSNFLKAIRLLYESTVGEGMSNLLSNWGGFGSIAHFKNKEVKEVFLSFEFDKDSINKITKTSDSFKTNPIYEIRIKKIGGIGEYQLEEYFYQKNSDFIFLKVENGSAVVSRRNQKAIGLERLEVFDPRELVIRQLSDPDQYFPIFTLKKAIGKITVYDYFDTTLKSPIRQLSSYYSETSLLPDGRNLTSLLNYLNGNAIQAYDKIIEEIKNLNIQIRELVFSTPLAGKTLLTLKEKELGKTISVEHISDGTLRFLLLMSILYNPNGGTIICLDEPEIGLHPDMINRVATAIKHASKSGSQIIVATHSPLLLNNFELEDLLIFEKNATNESEVKYKSEDNFENWEGEFLVGQMWLRGQIGGTRW